MGNIARAVGKIATMMTPLWIPKLGSFAYRKSVWTRERNGECGIDGCKGLHRDFDGDMDEPDAKK